MIFFTSSNRYINSKIKHKKIHLLSLWFVSSEKIWLLKAIACCSRETGKAPPYSLIKVDKIWEIHISSIRFPQLIKSTIKAKPTKSNLHLWSFVHNAKNRKSFSMFQLSFHLLQKKHCSIKHYAYWHIQSGLYGISSTGNIQHRLYGPSRPTQRQILIAKLKQWLRFEQQGFWPLVHQQKICANLMKLITCHQVLNGWVLNQNSSLTNRSN